MYLKETSDIPASFTKYECEHNFNNVLFEYRFYSITVPMDILNCYDFFYQYLILN